jgi:hypothetical protein
MSMAGPGIFLEQRTVFTVLGIQFWDQTVDQPVTDGLKVTAQLPGAGYPPVVAFRTYSGFYAFQGLPCLSEVEYPATEGQSQSGPPNALPFVITVADSLNRFLPMLFSVDLPLPYPGLFLSNDTVSPPGSGARAYLFSAPTRAAGQGIGVVRVDLWDHEEDKPAAFATLQVTIDGSVWTGIADEEGRAQIQFPSPLVQRLSLGSPPGIGQGPPSGMSWPIQVQARYQPEKLVFPLQSSEDVAWPWSITPSLKSVLDAQQPAAIWQQEAGPPVPVWTGNLFYGQELVLRTLPNAPTAVFSTLSISEVTSP